MDRAKKIRPAVSGVVGSLVIGHWSPVTGHWSPITGHWSLVTGHWSLVTGYRSLVTAADYASSLNLGLSIVGVNGKNKL